MKDGLRRTAGLFAEILDYPQSRVVGAVRECAALLSDAGHGEAADLLGAFQHFLEEVPIGRVEEIYTATFDLDAACCPYLGHHLFGESYKRSLFLFELKARYRRCGFAPTDGELPDHLVVLLRFLAMNMDCVLSQELIDDVLVPGFPGLMNGATEDPEGRTPYWLALRALNLVFTAAATRSASVLGASPPGGGPDV